LSFTGHSANIQVVAEFKAMVAQPSPDGDTSQMSDGLKSLDASSGGQSGRKSLWEGSSQYRHWRFSKETLRQQRTQINEAAVSAIKNAFEADEVSISDAPDVLVSSILSPGSPIPR
jgi:hypothetical protein